MRSTFKVLIVIVLMLAVFGQYTPASAAEMYKWKGPGAEAAFAPILPNASTIAASEVASEAQT